MTTEASMMTTPQTPQPQTTPRVYLSGPMTGLPDLNFPAFHAHAATLRARGHDVVNPAELAPDKGLTWEDCMRADLAGLATCDAIALMPGWHTSRGAHLELHIAHRLGLLVLFVESEIDRLAKDLADESARSEIEVYCRTERVDGHEWYDTSAEIVDAQEVRAGVDQALRYLDLRGTMQRHPTQPVLVRFCSVRFAT